MIRGLYETHLFVENLEKSIHFYSHIIGLKKCYEDPNRKAAFFWVRKPKKNMLGLWEKPKEQIDLRHFAFFQCDPMWILNNSINWLKERKLSFRNFLNNGKEEPMIFAWILAISIYFDVPDGHSLEFIGILEGEAKPELSIINYDEWKSVNS